MAGDKNCFRRNKYVVVKYKTPYLLKMKVPLQINIQTDIIQMVEFVIDNIDVKLGGHEYNHTVGIPMGTLVYHW